MKKLLFLAPLAFLACGGGGGSDSSGSTDPQTWTLAPDFSLLDVNPTSSTHNQLVSPGDFIGKITAWYFGNAN